MSSTEQQACCAHLRVSYFISTFQGLTTGWWACNDCDQRFMPKPRDVSSSNGRVCPYCKQPEADDGSIYHAYACAGLGKVEMNRLQHDALTAKIEQLRNENELLEQRLKLAHERIISGSPVETTSRLPEFIRRDVERAIDEAQNQKGMIAGMPKARIGIDRLQHMLRLIDGAAEETAADKYTVTCEKCGHRYEPRFALVHTCAGFKSVLHEDGKQCDPARRCPLCDEKAAGCPQCGDADCPRATDLRRACTALQRPAVKATAKYSGPIEIGMEFDWEPRLFHAHCRLRVTEVAAERVKAEVLSGQSIIGSQWWNDEDRFREACIPVKACPHSFALPSGKCKACGAQVDPPENGT